MMASQTIAVAMTTVARIDKPAGLSIRATVVIATAMVWLAIIVGLLVLALQGRPLLAL